MSEIRCLLRSFGGSFGGPNFGGGSNGSPSFGSQSFGSQSFGGASFRRFTFGISHSCHGCWASLLAWLDAVGVWVCCLEDAGGD